MTLGYTGTRNGMTQQQQLTVVELVARLAPRIVGSSYVFLHGCAEGGDREFHDVVQGRGPRHLYPSIPSQLEWAEQHAGIDDRIYDLGVDPIARNKVMVRGAEAFIAAPFQVQEQKRGSGTWATIRYLRIRKVPHYVVWPDGTVTPG